MARVVAPSGKEQQDLLAGNMQKMALNPPSSGKKKGKKGKSDEKKALKKQAQLERQLFNQQVNACIWAARFKDQSGTEVRSLVEEFAPFAKFNRNGLDLEIKQYARGSGETSQVPKDIMNYCVNLTETNMQQLYEDAGWGWNQLKKRRELEDEEARLLVASDKTTGEPVGFMHFRFLREDDATVLYVYELQVDQEKAGRKGLGKHMMVLVELAARKWGLDWCMLTVLDCNKKAQAFYGKLNYTIDETSPQMDVFEGESGETAYVILSKRMKKPE